MKHDRRTKTDFVPTIKRRIARSILLLTTTALASCGHFIHDESNAHQSQNSAKNVILFVGDGMGVSTVTAIRILDGQLRGETGEENILSWETFPNVALSKTYNTNQQVPDSAGTASALLTGVKTKAGFISVGPAPKRGECTASLQNALPTLFEHAENAGLATGIVTTARLTHATPATAYAHAPEREWESDSDMPQTALDAGCRDIARQLIEFSSGDGLEIALGGGRDNFLPKEMTDPENPGTKGNRNDQRDLTQEWLKQKKSAYIWNEEQFKKADTKNIDHLLGLFNQGHMQFELDRASDAGGEPDIADMTQKAIEMLQKNSDGYVLLVEGGRIDHGHHAGRAAYALHDGIALAKAVAVADQLTSDSDTLIIVTADHSHVFTMAGYPTRGNPILGKVIGNDEHGEPDTEFTKLSDGLPYTTLGYHNGPGAISGIPRPDLSNIDTTKKEFRQQALIPRSDETHGGEDVAIYAKGPGAQRIHGVMEQNEIYSAMAKALSLSQ